MPVKVGLRLAVAGLVLAVVTPVGVLGAVGVQRTWRRTLASLDRQNIATARAISVALEQEIEKTAGALNVLGELHVSDTPDPSTFKSLASRLLPYQSNWSAVLLADASGKILDSVPDGADGGALVGTVPWAKATVEARTFTVSNTFQLPDIGDRFAMIAVPIVRQGRVVFVLGARARTDTWSGILRQQQGPPNGAVAIVDGNHVLVARSREEQAYVGTHVTDAFLAASTGKNEGAWRGTGRDGTSNYSAFSRSPRTGLIVALGLPTAEIDAPVRRILLTLIGAWIVMLGSGAGLAMFLGGVIVRSLQAASRASTTLARGEPIVLAPSRIAELDSLADGLREAALALQARNRERDEASRLKDEFLMTVSHELRTPLTAICGWARMLSTGQILDVQRSRAMDAIERNANALHQLVNDLLDVSRIVSGKLRLDVQLVSLGEVIGAAIDTVRPAADAKRLQISTMIDPHAPVSGDPNRLQQVVWNLLSNAVKFTPPGGRIEVTVIHDGGEVEIAVADTGSGIQSDFLPHVFERFRQGESGTTRAFGGLGLGLAIVRHLAELHGGTVDVENNTPGPGATFRIRLPLAATPVGDAPAGRALAENTLREGRNIVRLDDMNVLVVDDDPHARELLIAILENAGASVKAAASAEDALVLLDTWSPDAMLSDIEMPNQDGYELMRQIRARETGRHLLGVAVTAHARPDDRSRALDAGYQWHLSKPIEPSELVSVVATLLAQTAGIN